MDIFEKYSVPSALDGVSTVEEWYKKREELKKLIYLEYGNPLPVPESVCFKEERSINEFASKATVRKGSVCAVVNGKEIEFPVKEVVPSGEGKHPVIVLLNFHADVPDKYFPAEEVIDRGYAAVSINYNDVTTDDNDFTTGIAPCFIQGERKPDDPGKIMMWAWAAMRVADCLEKESWADTDRLAVIGHSRLGKTALLTGALDERFAFIHSNNAGCCGDALFRVGIHSEKAEHIKNITDVFPYWFCPSFKEYADNEDKLPFDQHFLLSLIAPRRVNVASAILDQWACPEAQFACCKAASPVYEFLGRDGFIAGKSLPEPGTHFQDGEIGFHLRSGSHYLSREDWNLFMDFMDKKQ
ncbi:MAG: hypothetical protein MJ177_08365 [Clostridia bacterium]|nr:hypothetical protein [Clostridia bacterium]